MKGSGYETEEQANNAGLFYQDILRLTLARLRIGTDFGFRRGKGAFFDSFLEQLERDTGERMLNNVHGLMVYRTNPPPKFMSLPITMKLGCTKERFEKIFNFVAANPPEIGERDRIALEMFNTSFFAPSPDSRLIALVMAIECLIEPRERDLAAKKHVEHMIAITKENTELLPSDKNSYLGSLQWLLQESIGQAAKRLVTERLGNRTYKDLPPAQFLSKVYKLRSDLVHGNLPYPRWDEVGNWAANLEVFVAELIAHSTLEIA